MKRLPYLGELLELFSEELNNESKYRYLLEYVGKEEILKLVKPIYSYLVTEVEEVIKGEVDPFWENLGLNLYAGLEGYANFECFDYEDAKRCWEIITLNGNDFCLDEFRRVVDKVGEFIELSLLDPCV